MKSKSKPASMCILVVEDERQHLVKICNLLEEEGFKTEALLVCLGDDLISLARKVKAYEPDMILMDQCLGRSIYGDDLLLQVGGRFNQPSIPGGNPRVVSISSEPSREFLKFVGGRFQDKSRLSSDDVGLSIKAARNLTEVVNACRQRLGAV